MCVNAIWWGKVTTVAQFILLIGLRLGMHFLNYIYLIFIVMAAFAFVELFLRLKKKEELT